MARKQSSKAHKAKEKENANQPHSTTTRKTRSKALAISTTNNKQQSSKATDSLKPSDDLSAAENQELLELKGSSLSIFIIYIYNHIACYRETQEGRSCKGGS
jgi:hypothetical protein